jgi:hypothetical protein
LNHALFFDGVTIWNQPTRPQTSNEQILKQGMSYSSSNPWAHELEKKKETSCIFFIFLVSPQITHYFSLVALFGINQQAHKPANSKF